MMKEEKDIGDLLRNRILESEAQSNDAFDFPGEWKAIAPKVSKLNFFQWRFTHFNFYYAVGCFLSFVGIIFYLNRPANQLASVKSNRVIRDSVVEKGPSRQVGVMVDGGNEKERSGIAQRMPEKQDKIFGNFDVKEENDVNIAEGNPDGKEVSQSLVLDQFEAVQIPVDNIKDTIQQQKVKEPEVLQKVPKVKKVVVLSKQDTILKIDTVHKIKKKRIFH